MSNSSIQPLAASDLDHMLAGTSRASNRVYYLIRWSFYLFAFLIPMESVDLFGVTSVFSITKMAGFLFILLTLLQFDLCFAHPPAAFGWFALLLLVNFIDDFQSPESPYALLMMQFTWLQSIVLFWVCYNLMHNDAFTKRALLSYSAGTLAVALLVVTQIGERIDTTYSGERLSAFGDNTNIFSYYLSIGAIALLGLAVGRTKVKAMWALLPYAPCMLLIALIVRSGSRGSMLCLGVGIVVLLVRGGQFSTRLKTLLISLLLVVGGGRELLQSEVAVTRWQSTLESGELAGRDDIIRQSLAMFVEKPIFGWGPITHLYVLSELTQSEFCMEDTHNDLLWVMTANGLAGAIPFIIGVGLCLRSAWRGRKTIQGYLPLALILAVITMSMSVTVHGRKITWIVLAYAAASATYAAAPAPKRKSKSLRNAPEEISGNSGQLPASAGDCPDFRGVGDIAS